MKNNSKYLVAALAFALLTGCGGNQTARNTPGTPDYEMSERITTRTPLGNGTGLFGDNINGTGTNTDNNTLTNDGFGTAANGLTNNVGNTAGGTGLFNNDTAQLENTVAAQIRRLPSVTAAEVQFRDNIAYIACQVPGTAGNEAIRNQIVNSVKSSNPNIRKVYITTDANRFNQFRGMRTGGTTGNMTNNIGDVSNIFTTEQPIEINR